MKSASARTLGQRLTVVSCGGVSALAGQKGRRSRRSSSQSRSAAFSRSSQAGVFQRRLNSGRSIRPMLRSRLDQLDAALDDGAVVSGQCAAISVMGVLPWRSNQVVCSRRRPRGGPARSRRRARPVHLGRAAHSKSRRGALRQQAVER
jgi:hypothetical protein